MNLSIFTEILLGVRCPYDDSFFNHSESMDAPITRLYTRPIRGLPSRLGAVLLTLFFGGSPAWADEPADQLERAKVLREFQEAPTSASSSEAAQTLSLPAAAIEMERLRATDNLRSRQFEGSQWRKLLGDQQMQLYQPSSAAVSQPQWRAQMLERDRQAQDLSADILRRDLEYRSGAHR